MNTINKSVQVVKADQSLGLVFGFAIVSELKAAGGSFVEYEDLHGDIITEHEMTKAALTYAESERIMKAMHDESVVIGNIPFVMPLSHDILKSVGISAYEATGMLIAGKPEAQYMEKFVSGEWTGYSIGCTGIRVPK